MLLAAIRKALHETIVKRHLVQTSYTRLKLVLTAAEILYLENAKHEMRQVRVARSSTFIDRSGQL